MDSKWVDVNEKLPYDCEDVIVTIRDETGDGAFTYTTTAMLHKGDWIVDGEARHDVTHWMQYPEPYKKHSKKKGESNWGFTIIHPKQATDPTEVTAYCKHCKTPLYNGVGGDHKLGFSDDGSLILYAGHFQVGHELMKFTDAMAIELAKQVELPNYCANCGSKMKGE